MQAIFFDLDGTLRHSRPGGEEALVQYLAELGHPLTPTQQSTVKRWAHYYWSIAPEIVADFQEFGGETPAFWVRYNERRLRAIDFTGDVTPLALQIVQKYNDHYQPVDHVPADVRPTLQRLRAQGLIVGLVTNRMRPVDDYLRQLGLADLFDFTLTAGQVGSWKPDPVIFQHALARAGSTPTTTVYVGDNYYADVEGARNAGLTPVLIDPQRLFPDPGCPVITQLGELEVVLAQLNAQV